MNTEKRELAAIVVLFTIIMVIVTYLVIFGSRPARNSELNSDENGRVLRVLLEDCQKRGGCR